MPLINVETFRLCEIQRPDYNHRYVILSHTWGDDEVTFQEFSKETGKEGFSKEALKENARYSKIVRCCTEAELQGFNYVWIDTCCIDKASSSELSEAINSMYQWYKEASACYVYLSDVDSDKGVPNMMHFKHCHWFTRGWTLQELIAPRHVRFFDLDWSDIGTKLSLREEISDITGIPVKLLAGLKTAPLDSFCIAQRMFWAANRKTTRAEDIAYCLMGIFDVNMPILYGEGEKAFIRLQEEILKRSDDESLFAWIEPQPYWEEDDESWDSHLAHPSELRYKADPTFETSVLAPSPACFRYGQFIQCIEATGSQASPFSFTNKGLHISLPLIQTRDTLKLWTPDEEVLDESTALLAVLGCKTVDEQSCLAIFLIRHPSGRYFRVAADYLCRVPHECWQNDSGLPFSPDPTELYITTISHSSQNRRERSEVILSSVELTIINCTVIECGDACYLGDVYLFALTIKSKRTGLGDVMVVLFKRRYQYWVSCSVFQPADSAHFRQALLEWCTNHKDELEKNLSDFFGADRASLALPNGDKIAVSISIGANRRDTVTIQWTDKQVIHPRNLPLHVVYEQQQQDLRAYRDMQQRHRTKLDYVTSFSRWIIFSREVSWVPRDKQHLLGLLR